MCLIVHIPGGVPPDLRGDALAYASASTENNPDGWGVLYRASAGGQRWLVARGLDRAGLSTVLDRLADRAVEVVVHTRLATHGAAVIERTHPFKVRPIRGWIVHNGVFRGYPSRRDGPTDTERWRDEWLSPLIRLAGEERWNAADRRLDRLIGQLSGGSRVLIASTARTARYGAWVRGAPGPAAEVPWYSRDPAVACAPRRAVAAPIVAPIVAPVAARPAPARPAPAPARPSTDWLDRPVVGVRPTPPRSIAEYLDGLDLDWWRQ